MSMTGRYLRVDLDEIRRSALRGREVNPGKLGRDARFYRKIAGTRGRVARQRGRVASKHQRVVRE